MTPEINFQQITCTHPRDKQVIKEEYEEGSYYNKAEYCTYSICTVCGHKKLIHAEIGSYN
jgi:hypothetical protein